MSACLSFLLAMLLPVSPAVAAPLRAPPAAALLMHSPHDVIEAWCISPAFETDRTLFVSLPRFSLLLRSRDGGQSFQSAGAGLPSSYVTWLAISPDFARDSTLWCNEVRGLYVSHDAGESWAPLTLPGGLRDAAVLAVSPEYAYDGTLAVGTVRDGLWISRDRGATWSASALPGGAPGKARGLVAPVAFSPGFAEDSALLAVVSGGSLVRSTDGGESFTEVSAPAGGVQALALAEDFRVSGTLWIGTRGTGVWRSDDRGKTFQPEGAETAAMDVLHLSRAVGPEGGVLFASTAVDGVQVKPDGGQWTSIPTGFREQTHQTAQHYTGTMVSPAFARDHTVYAATFEGLYVSKTGGNGWQWLNVLHPHLVRNLALSRHFADDGSLWLSTYGAGLLASCDGGKTFAALDTAGWMFPDGIAASPDFGHDQTLLIGTPNRLLISTDGGETSRPALPGGKGFPRFVAFAPDWAQSGVAFAHFVNEVPSRNRLVRTADRGATWTDCNIRTLEELAFAPDWTGSHRAWAACPEGLFRSDDGGLTFARVAELDVPAVTSIAVAAGAAPGSEPGAEPHAEPHTDDGADAPPPGDILMACSRAAGVHVSRDGGQSWTLLSIGAPLVRPTRVRLSPAFARDGIAFAGPINDALRVTRDGGHSWSRVTGGPRIVLSLEISPTFETDHTLVVGSYESPWISRDAGASWTRLDSPVPERPAMSHEPAGTGGADGAPQRPHR